MAGIGVIDCGTKGDRLDDGDSPIHGVWGAGIRVLSCLVEPEGKGLAEGDVSRVESLPATPRDPEECWSRPRSDPP